MNKLEEIINQTMLVFGIDRDKAVKIVTAIDTSKMMGMTGGRAASRFADLLGFLRLPDDDKSHEYFAERWTDNRVWTPVNDDMRRFLNSSTPLFTQSRLEPQYSKTPYYELGIPKVELGVFHDPENGASLRRGPDPQEEYSNFIIHEYLPDVFYVEVRKNLVESILTRGLPDVHDRDAYHLHLTPEEARAGLGKMILQSGGKHKSALVREDWTLMELDTLHMSLDNESFYTKALPSHRGLTANVGYYYSGSVPARGCRVSSNNIAS